MAFLSDISLTWFRNFEQSKFTFDAPVVGIVGKNGIGKTNLLDAIYYLCYTKSYFQSRERYNIKYGRKGLRIEGHWIEENTPLTTNCLFKSGKKTIEQDGVAYEKVSEHIGKFRAVMIAPGDLTIVNDGSNRRRKFMDGILAQTDRAYLNHLLTYKKILKQKNTYLKNTEPRAIQHPLLDVYDKQLAQHGQVLLKKRQELSTFLPESLKRYYQNLCGEAKEQVNIYYQPCTDTDGLLNILLENRQYDLMYKRTVKGLHTEDWQFELNDKPLKTHASQGQKKSFLIALKLAELDWLRGFEHSPLLLMDDIFEKLDYQRINRLFELLASFNLEQLFITHTEAEDMRETLEKYSQQFQILKP